METTQLTVYKASAGSGKTFTLAVEYISLLIRNPMAYRTILAVTFTNKATEEMKQRILSQLYGIWKGLDSSEKYAREVMKTVNMSRSLVAERAGMALHNLIHDYNYFRVETIDSFFQRVLRNLARELDLTANLRVELNDNQVEEQAVDRLIDKLGQHDALLSWIIDYIQKNIDNDKSWNVIGQIKRFGKTIFRDFYKSESAVLNTIINDEKTFRQYIAQLEEIRTGALKRMNGYSKTFFSTIEAHGLTADNFAGKSKGIASYFRKLGGNDFTDKNCENQTLKKSLEDANNWVAKTTPDKDAILGLVKSELMDLLKRAEKDRPRQRMLYISADVTLRHLSQLRLLSSIEKEVAELNDEANRFLLSNTQQLLYDLIDNSDSPFVFEKIGAQLEHIMIDEFQDTSTVQWKNFKVLLEETMSHQPNLQGNNNQSVVGQERQTVNNMIVGDVKQSIYRWRSSDWRLLNNIGREFDNAPERLKIEPLDLNWRSCSNIIDFNNSFFDEASEQEYQNEKSIDETLAETIKAAYADVAQKKPKQGPKGGLVRITLLPKDDYPNQMMALLGKQVDELLSEGFESSDIAILVRSNKHIPFIADYFLKTRPLIKVVSDEAFRLDASQAVTTLVSAMRFIVHTDDKIALAHVEKTYMMLCGQPLGNRLDDSRQHLLNQPITDMAEELIKLLRLELLGEQSAYLNAFFDKLNDYAREFGTDVEGFLESWDDGLSEKTIQSDATNGIRLISIHKSKGLEFDNIIIPFCDWKLEMRDTLWCKPQVEPFNQLPLVPIDYSSRLIDSIYHDDYAQEHLQNCVDNLNLLYVAFTRASRNLFVIGRRDAQGTRSALIQKVIEKIVLPSAVMTGKDDNEDPIEYVFGTMGKPKEKKKKTETNVFLQSSETITVPIRTYDAHVEFRQSNKSKEFITNLEEEHIDEGTKKQAAYIRLGNIMHNVFSRIYTLADIPKVLRELEFEGMLYDEDLPKSRVKKMLEQSLSQKQVADWFSDKWTVHNECQIIMIGNNGELTTKRPDRVLSNGRETIVVDFKFGVQQEEHLVQVREYMQLLKTMGHDNVKGFLWYVYSNRVVEVTLTGFALNDK